MELNLPFPIKFTLFEIPAKEVKELSVKLDSLSNDLAYASDIFCQLVENAELASDALEAFGDIVGGVARTLAPLSGMMGKSAKAEKELGDVVAAIEKQWKKVDFEPKHVKKVLKEAGGAEKVYRRIEVGKALARTEGILPVFVVNWPKTSFWEKLGASATIGAFVITVMRLLALVLLAKAEKVPLGEGPAFASLAGISPPAGKGFIPAAAVTSAPIPEMAFPSLETGALEMGGKPGALPVFVTNWPSNLTSGGGGASGGGFWEAVDKWMKSEFLYKKGKWLFEKVAPLAGAAVVAAPEVAFPLMAAGGYAGAAHGTIKLLQSTFNLAPYLEPGLGLAPSITEAYGREIPSARAQSPWTNWHGASFQKRLEEYVKTSPIPPSEMLPRGVPSSPHGGYRPEGQAAPLAKSKIEELLERIEKHLAYIEQMSKKPNADNALSIFGVK